MRLGGGALCVCLILSACAAPAPPAPRPAAPAAASTPLWGSKPPPGGPDRGRVPPELLSAIIQAEWVGHLLYELDHMADVAGGFLATRVTAEENQALAGSFTMPEAPDSGQPRNSYVGLFLTRENPARIAFRVHMAPDREPVLEKVSPAAPAPGEVLFQLRARETAMAAIPGWNGAMKAIVLPGRVIDRPASLVVYLIRRERHARELATGMHYRVFVSGDGVNVQKVDPIADVSNVVLLRPEELSKREFSISNFRLGHPSEIDVFSSLVHQSRVFVTSARLTWRISEGTIIVFGPAPPDSWFLGVMRDQLAKRAAANGMPASELPSEYR